MTMIATNASTITPDLPELTTGPAEDDLLLTTGVNLRNLLRQQWNDIVDHTLIEWGNGGDHLGDDSSIPPSRFAIHQAIAMAQQLRDLGLPQPNHIVPNGDGGIIFRWVRSPYMRQVDFLEDGDVEVFVFHGNKIIYRG